MKFYNEIISKLKSGEPFKFSRWGDGEWLCMIGAEGHNRDGNTYIPELGTELLTILNSQPGYYIGIQHGVFYNERLRVHAINELFRNDTLNLVDGDILHKASEFGYLQPFIDALKSRNTVIIGTDYFSALPFRHIVTPGTNSYDYNEKIFREIDLMDETGHNYNPVYLVASAMNSNVIIDKLPDNVTAIDIGSVLDPYLGINRAAYQRNTKFKPLW